MAVEQVVCSVTITTWQLFTKGQMKQRETSTHNPQLTVAPDYSNPLISAINVYPLFLPAPL